MSHIKYQQFRSHSYSFRSVSKTQLRFIKVHKSYLNSSHTKQLFIVLSLSHFFTLTRVRGKEETFIDLEIDISNREHVFAIHHSYIFKIIDQLSYSRHLNILKLNAYQLMMIELQIRESICDGDEIDRTQGLEVTLIHKSELI